MGGRGRSSGYRYTGLPPDLAQLPYNLISHDQPLGGAVYPFLAATGRAWHILTRPVALVANAHPAHTFGLTEPTLRWVGTDSVSDLYIDGLDTAAFLQASGLELHLDKGAYVLSKRLARLMRPHFVSGRFALGEVKIDYMTELNDDGQKVWDGAGLISRDMLRKLALSEEAAGDALSPARRERLEQELATAGRVEFTVMTANGQDKGHAIVTDDLRDTAGNPVDFLLPCDTKREIRLVGGETFVGLDFVHSHDQMRLDIQSLINLHPFFHEEQLLTWLREEGDLFLEAVETGRVAEAMGRIDRHTDLTEVQSWPLREYLASGGHPLWFGSHARSLLNQHLERLNQSTLEKLRLPIPGGRYYVMPAAVGQRAGLDVVVGRGQVELDKARGTAWINDQDWLRLPDSPTGAGIAAILGGADNDDALWLHPFTDTATSETAVTAAGADASSACKLLAWRSPNQLGEYLLFTPTARSRELLWTQAGEQTVTYPAADSRQLPPRIDHTTTHYLHLVDPATAGGLGEGQNYSPAVMDAAIARAIQNQGALGMYCNSLMLNKALYGRLPENPPAPLEDVIDSSVKTGADLSQVVAWNYENSAQILRSRVPIPAILHQRLSYDRQAAEKSPLPIPSQGHWLDRLTGGVQEHIAQMRERRDALAAAAVPPQQLFDAVLAQPELVKWGAGFNQAYAGTLNRLAQERPFRVPAPADYEAARAAAEDYLARFPPRLQTAVLRGAMVSAYVNSDLDQGKRAANQSAARERNRSEGAVWLAGAKEPGGRAPGIGHKAVTALREIGALDELDVVQGRVMAYPNAAPAKAAYQTLCIREVWRHRYGGAADSPAERRRTGAQTAQFAANSAGQKLRIRRQEEGTWAYTADGRPLGVIASGNLANNELPDGGELTVRGGLSRNGDLWLAVEKG
jgi:hypothetical protein